MKDVVSLTEGLFALSKVSCQPVAVCGIWSEYARQETAKLENDAFVQRQKVALASELKSVLDSWVRYEQQQKESEQTELAKTVISKVLAGLKDEKTQKDILTNAIGEVEREWFHHMYSTVFTLYTMPGLVQAKAI